MDQLKGKIKYEPISESTTKEGLITYVESIIERFRVVLVFKDFTHPIKGEVRSDKAKVEVLRSVHRKFGERVSIGRRPPGFRNSLSITFSKEDEKEVLQFLRILDLKDEYGVVAVFRNSDYTKLHLNQSKIDSILG